MLGPMAGRVNAAQDDLAEGDLVPVVHRVVRELGLGGRMDTDGKRVLEREPPVAGDVVGVRVSFDHTRDLDAAAVSLLEVLLDRVGGIHDRGRAGVLVADEVRRAAEVVVDELGEDHSAPEGSTGSRYFS